MPLLLGVGRDTSVSWGKNPASYYLLGPPLVPLNLTSWKQKPDCVHSFIQFIPISNREFHQPAFVWQHTVHKNPVLTHTQLSIKMFHILLQTLSFSTGFAFVHFTSNFISVTLLMLVRSLFLQCVVLLLGWNDLPVWQTCLLFLV